jgi:hypothetical protein
MKQLTTAQLEQINGMLTRAQPGDLLAVRSRSMMGFFIRRMLSKGLHPCHTNHNAPVFGRVPRILQIEPPTARIMWLSDYLADLYRHGGKAILLRPDSFLDGVPPDLATHFDAEYTQLAGLKYDRMSIRMFLRMIYRKAAQVPANGKASIYCTEGSLIPILINTIKPWKPDILKNEGYPAPIHIEHLIRQNRLEFIDGDRELFDKILR